MGSVTFSAPSVFSEVDESPGQFPSVAPGVERALVRRFPYGIYFTAESDRVIILGVFHQHRDPSIWRDRL
jgi:plasmid stabilization system protein ParE